MNFIKKLGWSLYHLCNIHLQWGTYSDTSVLSPLHFPNLIQQVKKFTSCLLFAVKKKTNTYFGDPLSTWLSRGSSKLFFCLLHVQLVHNVEQGIILCTSYFQKSGFWHHSCGIAHYIWKKKLITNYPFCSWMSNIHELRRGSDVSRWRSLTHSILINLFIKSGLNNFLLPPLLSIVFVQACSVIFWWEGTKRRTFSRACVRVSRTPWGWSRPFCFMCFSFVNMLFIAYRL